VSQSLNPLQVRHLNWFLIQLETLEILERDEFAEVTEDKREEPDCYAHGMLLESQGSALDGLSSILYQQDLHDNCDGDDDKEHGVVEEVCEHIEFFVPDLPTVDLVEHLHEDERVEDEGIVEASLRGPKLIGPSELNVEDPTAPEKEDREDNDLEEALTQDVSPHRCRDDIICFRVGLSFDDIFFRGLSCQSHGSKCVHD
jgi:hypothetical protein